MFSMIYNLIGETKEKKRILVWAAMKSELGHVLKNMGIEVDENIYEYEIERENTMIRFVSVRKCPRFKCESIGTVAAALSVDKQIREFQPDLVINCGTAGGFKERGAAIGKVYSCSKTIFHDRHISFDPYKTYGIFETEIPYCEEVGKQIGLAAGVLSTGDNFDVVSEEEKSLWEQYEVTCKDMEGASVAYTVLNMHENIKALFVKVVVDLLGQDEEQKDQFLQNLAFGCERLGVAMKVVLDHLENPELDLTFTQELKNKETN